MRRCLTGRKDLKSCGCRGMSRCPPGLAEGAIRPADRSILSHHRRLALTLLQVMWMVFYRGRITPIRISDSYIGGAMHDISAGQNSLIETVGDVTFHFLLRPALFSKATSRGVP